jgi:DHA1 family multidrug resistance protein-like MFS transporter
MPIYILTLAVFVVLQVPTALATNYGMLIAFRFLTGLFGSPILATGGATIADLYAPKKRAYDAALRCFCYLRTLVAFSVVSLHMSKAGAG